jgi:hypothetical protein
MTRQNYYARRQARQRREVDADLVVALVMEERKIQLGFPRFSGHQGVSARKRKHSWIQRKKRSL